MNSSKGMNSLNFVNVKKKGKDVSVKRGQTAGAASSKFAAVASTGNKSHKFASNIRSRASAAAAGASSTNPQDFATYKAADDASRLGERRRSSDAAPMDWTSPSVDQMMANLMQSLKQLAPLPGDEGWQTPEVSPIRKAKPDTLLEGDEAAENALDPATPPVEMVVTPGSSAGPSRTASAEQAAFGKSQTIFEFVEASQEVQPGVMLRKMSGMLRIEPGAGGGPGREATIRTSSTTSTGTGQGGQGPVRPFPGGQVERSEGQTNSAFGAMERSLSREQLLAVNSGILRSESAPVSPGQQQAGTDFAHSSAIPSKNAGAEGGAPKFRFDSANGSAESQLAAAQEALLQARKELITLQCDNHVMEKQLAQMSQDAARSQSPIPELLFDEDGNLAGSEDYKPSPQDSPETVEWVSILEKQIAKFRTECLNMEKERDDAREEIVKVKTEAEETKTSLEQRLMQAVHDLTVRETEFKEKLEEDERFEEEVERKEHQTQEEQFRTRAFLEAREGKMRKLEEEIARLRDGEEISNMMTQLSDANLKIHELENELGPLRKAQEGEKKEVEDLKQEIEEWKQKYEDLETRWQATQEVAEKASAQAETLATKKSQLMMKTAVAFTALESVKKKLGEEQVQRQMSAEAAESYQLRNERADLRKMEAEEQKQKLWAENLSLMHKLSEAEKQVQLMQEFVQEATNQKDAEEERRLEAVRQAVMDHEKLFEHEMIELCKENNTLFLRLLDIKMKFGQALATTKIPDIATKNTLREIVEQATQDLQEVTPEAEVRYASQREKQELARAESRDSAAEGTVTRTSSQEGFSRRKSVSSESDGGFARRKSVSSEDGGLPARNVKVTHMRRYIFMVNDEEPNLERRGSTESKQGQKGRRRGSVSKSGKKQRGTVISALPNSGSQTDYLTTETFRIGYFHVSVPDRDERRGKPDAIKLKKPKAKVAFEDFTAPEEAFLPRKKGSKQEGNPRKLQDSVDVLAVLQWLAEVDPYGKEDTTAMFLLAKEVIVRSFNVVQAIDAVEEQMKNQQTELEDTQQELENKQKELDACKEQLSGLQESLSFLEMDQEGKTSEVDKMRQRITEQDAEITKRQEEYQSMLQDKNKEIQEVLARSPSSNDQMQSGGGEDSAQTASADAANPSSSPPGAPQQLQHAHIHSHPSITRASKEVQTEGQSFGPELAGHHPLPHLHEGQTHEGTLKELWGALDGSMETQRQLEQALQDVHRRELAAIRHMAEKLEISANELARIKAGGALDETAIDALGTSISEQVEELLAEQLMIEDALQNREDIMKTTRDRLKDIHNMLQRTSVDMGYGEMALKDPTSTSHSAMPGVDASKAAPGVRAAKNAKNGGAGHAAVSLREGANPEERQALSGWGDSSPLSAHSRDFAISLQMESHAAARSPMAMQRVPDDGANSPSARSPDRSPFAPGRPPARGRLDASGSLNDSAEVAEELMRNWNIDSEGFLPQWMKNSTEPSESDAGLDSSFLSKQTAEEDWDDANVPYPMRQQHPSRMKARIDALTKHANIARVRLFEEHQEVRIRYLTEQLQRAFEKIRDLEMTLMRHEKRKKAVVKLAIARGRELERKKMAGEAKTAELMQELPNIPSEQWPPSRLAFRYSSASPTMQLPSLTDRKPKTMGGEDGFAQFKKAYREQEAKERLLREFAARSQSADPLPGVKTFRARAPPEKLSRDGLKERKEALRKKSAPGPMLVSPWGDQPDDQPNASASLSMSKSVDDGLLGALLQQEIFNTMTNEGQSHDQDMTPSAWLSERASIYSSRAMSTEPLSELHPIYEDAASWLDEDAKEEEQR